MQSVQAPAWNQIGSNRDRAAQESARIGAQLKNLPLYKPPIPAKAKLPSAEVGLTKRLADEIELVERFAQDAGERLYVYKNGVYRAEGRQVIHRYTQTLLEDWGLSARWSSHRAEEVMQYIQTRSPQLQERPPLNCLNLRNGLLDLERGELVSIPRQSRGL